MKQDDIRVLVVPHRAHLQQRQTVTYGVTQPEIIDRSRQGYACKLQACFNWAFKVAKDVNEKESQHQKHYYDHNMCCQKLVLEVVVLVKKRLIW